MNQVFKLCPIDIGQMVCRNNFHVGEKKSRVKLGIGNPLRDVAAGHTYFVKHVTMGSDGRIGGLAAQDIDRAAGQVAIFALACKERPGGCFL